MEVRVVGTTPLSFKLRPGMILDIKSYSASANNRPTVGGKFKNTAYLLFAGVTKVGRLSPAALKKIGSKVPDRCTVARVDAEKNVLMVSI